MMHNKRYYNVSVTYRSIKSVMKIIEKSELATVSAFRL